MTVADAVWGALGAVSDPELRRPLTELGMIERVDEREDGSFEVELRLTIVGCPAARQIERDVRTAIESAIDGAPYELEVGVMTREQRTALTERLRGSRAGRVHPFGKDSLTRVIAVTSGKGGVGKSTVTANLAAAFARRGLSVGLIDADVHGYSIPGLFGLGDDVSPTRVGDMIVPPEAHGVRLISIGMFLGDGAQVVAWRGPMLHRTIEQFLTDVYFGDLDVLLLDLPPGTGDIAISLGQLLPGAEVVVVTTPQAAAAEVAWRSGALARKTGQRVIGVIETMSPFASAGGERVALFGEGGGRAVADRLSEDGSPVELLAEVPVSQSLRESGDAGTPLLRQAPTTAAGIALQRAADALLAQPRGLSGRRLPVSLV
ncbi:Mrp/NBP35 family ATP-binding protein [Pseudoclavibacter terrae]|uniref:Iron-sulfur cluster carrier protein n=1 Tax=Pseudoclavibacter terrae TaxID=1530195 RepID=A0A7J5B667_9MICO|nr:P-loop NTPase [Pseudoclavibacter terrae]KAB1639658.1 Mrp/NBP35 family ATP-binding protein [Pseudoclavibacter terrae]